MKASYLVFLLFLLLAFSCKEKPENEKKEPSQSETKEEMGQKKDYSITEIYSEEPVDTIIKDLPKYTHATALYLGAEINCPDMEALFAALKHSNIENLLMNNIICTDFPANLEGLTQLKALILESSYLDHIPPEVIALPALETLEFSSMQYNTYTGPIPPSSKLSTITFGSTPVSKLGNLSKLPSLKQIYASPNEDLEQEVQQLKKTRPDLELITI